MENFLNLSTLSLFLDKAKELVLRCRAVRDSGLQRDIKYSDRFEAFKNIAEKCVGVYVVRLCEGACVFHDFSVDMNEGVIIDS